MNSRGFSFVTLPGYDDKNDIPFKLHASDIDTKQSGLYARFALNNRTVIPGALAGNGYRHVSLRASNAYLAVAWSFVAAANCELFSANVRKLSNSPKKRKTE
jgi:hypothetical protein